MATTLSEAAIRRPDEMVPFLERMKVVRELMKTLEVVTYAGQHHVMNRVLDILRRDLARAELPPTDPRAATLGCALMDLRREAERVSPKSSVFNGRAIFVVEVLFEIRSEQPARDSGDV